jgi:hypothetical protein
MAISSTDILDWQRISTVTLSLISIYLVFMIARAVRNTIRARRRYHDIPQLPRHPIWGHLVNMGEKLNPALMRHADYAFEETWKSLSHPGAFLMDLFPVVSWRRRGVKRHGDNFFICLGIVFCSSRHNF